MTIYVRFIEVSEYTLSRLLNLELVQNFEKSETMLCRLGTEINSIAAIESIHVPNPHIGAGLWGMPSMPWETMSVSRVSCVDCVYVHTHTATAVIICIVVVDVDLLNLVPQIVVLNLVDNLPCYGS
jgi:hypothetical protein